MDFRSDLMAGLVVGMVAIPLGMALAIASGVAPQSGLYTVIIAGGIVALLGGSRFQVTGPTAAFVVILVPIVEKFGFSGLLISGFLSGILLVLMGVLRLGKIIQFIPYPVTTGFTAGIALVIATIQVRDFFGLRITRLPEGYLEKIKVLFGARGTFSFPELTVGFSTLLILLIWPRLNRKIPAPLVALSAVSILAVMGKKWFPHLEIATIGTRFTYVVNGGLAHGIPQTVPQFHVPWNFPDPRGHVYLLGWDSFKPLFPSAFAIAMLGAIESLLSAVIADGMTQARHDPDSELVALGIGNMICPFFGGIAATGAIARTATNIRFGAKSPFAAFIHAVFTLLVILLFAPYVSCLPMAALAALLLLVAYNMSELKHFIHVLRVAPRSDTLVLLLCFGLTVLFDMVIGVTVGVMLASLLFMRRMIVITQVNSLAEVHQLPSKDVFPKEAMFYEIAGPLFFGTAKKAIEAISGITDRIQVIIFYLRDVPVLDMTALIEFEGTVHKLLAHQKLIILVGLRDQPAQVLKKSKLLQKKNQIRLCKTLEEAALITNEYLKKQENAELPFSSRVIAERA